MSFARWTRRGLAGALLLALAVVLAPVPGAAAPAAADAEAMVRNVGDDVLAILKDESLTSDQKLEHLIDLLEGPIDLDLVARLILGRHWRTATPEQQAEYLDLFRAYALDSLASKLHLYQGQVYEITSAKVLNERDALVTTRIVSDSRPPLSVDWRLREVDGELVAIDVIVENVSMIVTQRSEFSSVVERQGIDGLLAELRQRIESNRPA